MSTAAELIDRLIASGMTPADAATLFARAAVEMSAAGPSKAALRTRKWRAGKTSQSVTGDAPVTPATAPSQNVTERHKPSQNVTPEPPTYILSSLPTNSEERTESKKTRAPKNSGVTLPDGWQPDRQFAKALGWTDQRVDTEAQRFQDSAISKARKYVGEKGWAAAWRNWCTSPFQQTPNGSPNNRSGGFAAQHEFLTRKLAEEERDERANGTAEPEIFSPGDQLALPDFHQP